MAQTSELDALRRAVQTQADVMRERTAPEPESEDQTADIESSNESAE